MNREDQEGVNCLIVRSPHLQDFRLENTRTGERFRAEITGTPYHWRWVQEES